MDGGFSFLHWSHLRLLISPPRIAIHLNRASEDIVLLQHLQAEAWQKECFSTHLVPYPVMGLPSGSLTHALIQQISIEHHSLPHHGPGTEGGGEVKRGLAEIHFPHSPRLCVLGKPPHCRTDTRQNYSSGLTSPRGLRHLQRQAWKLKQDKSGGRPYSNRIPETPKEKTDKLLQLKQVVGRGGGLPILSPHHSPQQLPGHPRGIRGTRFEHHRPNPLNLHFTGGGSETSRRGNAGAPDSLTSGSRFFSILCLRPGRKPRSVRDGGGSGLPLLVVRLPGVW